MDFNLKVRLEEIQDFDVFIVSSNNQLSSGLHSDVDSASVELDWNESLESRRLLSLPVRLEF